MTAASRELLSEAEGATPEPIGPPVRPAWWVAAALPLAVGGAVATLAALGPLLNPILYLRASLFSFALLAGGVLSGLWLAWLLGVTQVRRQCRRAYQRQRREAAAERLRFLGRLHHEFNSPLMAIRFGLANVRSSLAADASQGDLAIVEAQVVRLGQLTENLQKLADLKMQPAEHAPVDVDKMLREATAVVLEQPGLADRKINLALAQTPISLPNVPGDRGLLVEAIYNLLDNACKFTRPDDMIEVHACEDGRMVRIDISDTGPGIPEDELAHLGEDLYRGKGAEGIPGTGLGLALVRAIVERHGGTLTIRSQVGKGTMVTLRLPIE